MYPYVVFLDMDLYSILLCVAIAAAILTFRFFGSKRDLSWRVQNFAIITAAAAIVVGYFSAMFFQALYNIKERGEFVIDASTGATFYGGLIGGAVCFLAIYFGIGCLLFKRGEHKKSFFLVADIAAASISVAHGIGRIGCLMSGCCHGGRTDAWYGIYMASHGYKVVPIQLYEALFLFALFALFIYRLIKGKSCNLPIYMATYGVWRFVIEFFRKDYRGDIFLDFFSPSQFIALVMVMGAVGLFFLQKALMNKIAAGDKPECPEVAGDD